MRFKDHPKDKEQQAYNYFIGKGYSPQAAIGIVGNLLHESRLNPVAEGDVGYKGGSSFGIGMFRTDRLKSLKKMYGDNWTDFSNQLEFVDHELKTTHKKAGDLLKSAADINEAGQVFSDYYEIPAKKYKQDKNRRQQVEMLANRVGNFVIETPPEATLLQPFNIPPVNTSIQDLEESEESNNDNETVEPKIDVARQTLEAKMAFRDFALQSLKQAETPVIQRYVEEQPQAQQQFVNPYAGLVPSMQEGGTINNLNQQQTNTVRSDAGWLNNWLTNRQINGIPLPKDYNKVNKLNEVYVDELPPNEYGNFDTVDKRVILSNDLFMTKPGIATHELNHFSHMDNKYYDQYVKNPIQGVVQPNSYTSQPDEIHSELMRLRQQEGYSPTQNVTPEQIKNIRNRGDYNLNDLNDEQLLQLLNTTASLEENNSNKYYAQQGGRVIEDDRGQWRFPGEVTRINSSNITMKGVNYPVLGIDNLGNMKMMYPGNDYQYPGTVVTEYPQTEKIKLKKK